MKFRTIYIKNGDMRVPYKIYTCACCGEEIEEAWEMVIENNEVYCGECAFISQIINEQEYLDGFCFSFGCENRRAAVHEGKVYVGIGKFPWEKSNKEKRCSKENQEWRTAVFERDHYTCAICQQVGGNLNAHHIKPFKDFEADRFNTDNGITLCETCHRRVHKEKDPNWIKGE